MHPQTTKLLRFHHFSPGAECEGGKPEGSQVGATRATCTPAERGRGVLDARLASVGSRPPPSHYQQKRAPGAAPQRPAQLPADVAAATATGLRTPATRVKPASPLIAPGGGGPFLALPRHGGSAEADTPAGGIALAAGARQALSTRDRIRLPSSQRVPPGGPGGLRQCKSKCKGAASLAASTIGTQAAAEPDQSATESSNRRWARCQSGRLVGTTAGGSERHRHVGALCSSRPAV